MGAPRRPGPPAAAHMASSEYEPLFPDAAAEVGDGGDLATVQDLFRAASGPYLRSYGSWLAWAVVLPAAAMATVRVAGRFGPAGVLLTWSGAILAGGAIEMTAIRRGSSRNVVDSRIVSGERASQRGRASRSPLAAWALRSQGNLSLVALALSVLLVWQDLAWALPGIWLLLLGHSFYTLGGIAFPPFRLYGLLYQAGGIAALWPGGAPLAVFALTAAVGNLWMTYAVWRERHGAG
jgi:hypothetical protein